MKHCSILILCIFLLSYHYTLSQDKEKTFSFNAGLNLSYPKFIDLNKDMFEKTIPGWQFSINKDFFAEKPYGLISSFGVNHNSFNVGRTIVNLYSVKQINLTYASFELGPYYKFYLKKITLLGGANFRASRILSQNYNDYYTRSFGKSDSGLNFRIGTKFITLSKRPYLLINYYYGLSKLAKNFIVTSNGESYKDYIRNRSIGLQLGFYF